MKISEEDLKTLKKLEESLWIHASLPLQGFAIHPITENVVLVTYISKVQNEKLDVGNRSSLWLKTSNGWQLQFHQGTPVMKS